MDGRFWTLTARERVVRCLARRGEELPPRGELFISGQFLDRWCSPAGSSTPGRLGYAAQLLGLDVIGADLNGEESSSLLAEGQYRTLSEYFVVGCVNGPVSHLIESFGFSGAMILMKRDRESFLDLARKRAGEIGATCARAGTNGMSAIAVTDDIAGNGGLLFSFDDFMAAVLPVYREIAAAIRAQGLDAFFHCDGAIVQIIDSLIDAGYGCIHPVDAQAGMNLFRLREAYGDRISFMGHIDAVAWDAEKVEEEIRRAERTIRSGGLIIGTSGGMPAGAITPGLSALYPVLKVSSKDQPERKEENEL
ncbi:MAG TPA: uroporphyrinogen decarboxylase family protein [Syntrophorhabdaceae bacterium]|jgi:hypothetical protein